MLKGTPLLINVEGSYVKLEHLINLAPNYMKEVVSGYVTCIRNQIWPKDIEFMWSRNVW